MVTIPLYIILFIYFASVAIIGIFFIINVLHLYHGGAFTLASFIFTIFIFIFTVANLFFTYNLLANTDWQLPITIWNSSWVNNTLDITTF